MTQNKSQSMAGQFPPHQAGGTPIALNNYSGWNQPPHQQPPGQGIPTGTSQSVVHGMLPQPQLPLPSQLAGSPPQAVKLPNVGHNGAGGLSPASVINLAPQASLPDNLRHNFQMFMNQNKKNINTSSPDSPIGTIDLSQSPRRVDSNKSSSLGTHQINKDSSLISQSPVVSAPVNGEIHARTSAGVSVIANSSLSPSKLATVSTIQSPAKVNQMQNSIASAMGSVVKQEPETLQGVGHSSNSGSEPPLINVKEEENVKHVNSPVIVGSSQQSQVPTVVAPFVQACAPVSSLSSKQDAMDVESQLEALFAGIADDGNSSKELKPLPGSTSVNQQGTPNVAAVLESKGSTNKKGKGKANGVVKNNDVAGPSSSESTPRKKRKKKIVKPWEEEKNKKAKKGSTYKGKFVKEASCDSGSNASSSRLRGPVVHIEGTKEAPTSLSVVNAPSRQDDDDNDGKKKSFMSGRIRKSQAVEGKLSTTGLCSNSLMSRYEAHSSDPRWVCVFCKRGCHIEGLGDLFGPYLVYHDADLENALDLEADWDRKKDKKAKRSAIGQTGVLGLLPIPPLSGEQPQFMVYFHENCAVWSPSINLIGSRLTGVQEAVWVAVRSKCGRCHLDGANIGCVCHGCSLQVHYPCARDSGWSLSVDTFVSSCHIHKKVHETPLLPAVISL